MNKHITEANAHHAKHTTNHIDAKKKVQKQKAKPPAPVKITPDTKLMLP